VSRSAWVIVNQRCKPPRGTTRSPVLFAWAEASGLPGKRNARAGSSPARPGAPLAHFRVRFPRAEATGLSLKTNGQLPVAGASLQLQGHTLPANLSRVRLGGRALPRRGRGGWFDSIHAHEQMPPFHGSGRSATNADGEGSSPSGGTSDEDGLRSGTSLVSKTGRAGFDPSAACHARSQRPLGSRG
jgi:hypothetical protein